MSKDPRNEREAAEALGCGPCNGNCRQGRDCPERGEDVPRWAEVLGTIAGLVGASLVVLAILLAVQTVLEASP